MGLHRNSDLFAGSGSLLDIAHADPVLQIITPRSDAPDWDRAKTAGLPVAGTYYLLHDATGKSQILVF
jgi:hypothetical protein